MIERSVAQDRETIWTHHQRTFKQLSEITGLATDILHEPATEVTAPDRVRAEDRLVQERRANHFWRSVEGPFAIAESVEHCDYVDPGPVSAMITADEIDMTDQGIQSPSLEENDFGRLPIFGISNAAEDLIENPGRQQFLEIASGRQTHYYYAHSRTPIYPSPDSISTLQIHAPIGEYGAAFARQLLQSTYHTMGCASPDQQTQLQAIAEPHDALLNAHVTWARHIRNFDQPGPSPLGFALMQSVYEGDLSIQQAISLLTAEKVPGFTTGLELWSAIKKAKLLEQFTRDIPFGHLAPLTTMNGYVPGLVIPNEEGVRLNPTIVAQLKAYKEDVKGRIAAALRDGKHVANNEMGIFCPAAHRNGGLEKRHDLLFRRHVLLLETGIMS